MISFTRVGKLVSQTSEPLAARSSALVSMYAILKTKVFQKHKKEDCRNAVLKNPEPMTSSKTEVQRFSRSKRKSSAFFRRNPRNPEAIFAVKCRRSPSGNRTMRRSPKSYIEIRAFTSSKPFFFVRKNRKRRQGRFGRNRKPVRRPFPVRRRSSLYTSNSTGGGHTV